MRHCAYPLNLMGLNIAYSLAISATKFADHPAIVCENRTYTFAELDRWTAQIAEVLLAHGFKKGDHILLLAPNVPEFTAVYYAALRVGGVVVPVNTLFLANEIAGLLEHSDAKFMFVWHALAEKGTAAFEQAETCRTLFFMGTDQKNLSPDLFPNVPKNTPCRQSRFLLDELAGKMPGAVDYCQTMPDDTAVILYTSGTTGKSKGVELSHFNLYSNAFYTKDHILLLQPGDVTIAILPLFHTFGQTVVQNASIMWGAKMVQVSLFEPRRVLGEIEKHRVTHVVGVPTMYNLMLQTQRRYNYDVSALKAVVSGGASLPVALFHEFEQVFHVRINEGYGLSETSPVATFTPPHKGSLNKPGSIGPELFGTQVRIVREDGTFADVEEVGELVIRGHNVMKGYYKDSAATESAFLENGWFRSGDIAKMDADGYFYIVDRAKDVIIRGGMNIYPREIEEVLHHHPAVWEAAVVGIPDETLSENVVAFVALVPDATVTAQELQKYCRDHLAIYKCPKRIEFVERLPKNSTGKIMKRTLREKKGTA